MAQMTDSRKGVPFRGFIDIAPHFGGEIPQNLDFGGMNRRFQARRSNQIMERLLLSKLLHRF